MAEGERDYGCLNCKVTWRGAPRCWLCGDVLFVVGSDVLRSQTEAR